MKPPSLCCGAVGESRTRHRERHHGSADAVVGTVNRVEHIACLAGGPAMPSGGTPAQGTVSGGQGRDARGSAHDLVPSTSRQVGAAPAAAGRGWFDEFEPPEYCSPGVRNPLDSAGGVGAAREGQVYDLLQLNRCGLGLAGVGPSESSKPRVVPVDSWHLRRAKSASLA